VYIAVISLFFNLILTLSRADILMPDSFIYLSRFKGVLRGGDIAIKGT